MNVWENHISQFSNYILLNRRMSVHTHTAYSGDLGQFSGYLQTIGSPEPEQLKAQHIRGWMSQLLESGLSARSVHRKISSVRALLKWMRRQGIVEHDPMAKISTPKLPRRIVQDIPAADLQALFARFPWHEYPDGENDRRILLTFYTTGMRLSELIGLKCADVDLDRLTLTVTGKRNKMRLIPIHPELAELLAPMLIRKTGPLFTLPDGNPLYPVYVYRKVNFYLQLFSNALRTSPHILRHSFATHLLNNGANLMAIKEILGHTSLSATQVYTRNSFEKLKQVHLLHPRK
ncbi:MAG: tyrosine-type recombinase/integrase [Bacteroidetes bacterium]|nr:tyrosine-type recombinase/integrase [Bacteroidota bacterium]